MQRKIYIHVYTVYTCYLICQWCSWLPVLSDEDEEDQDAVLYLPVSPDIEEPEESAWAIPPEVLTSVCNP